jgi:hypothetical protein
MLFGGLEHEFYDFPYLGNVIIPTDQLVFFRGVETTNQHDYIVSHSGDSGYGMDDDWGPIHPV